MSRVVSVPGGSRKRLIPHSWGIVLTSGHLRFTFSVTIDSLQAVVLRLRSDMSQSSALVAERARTTGERMDRTQPPESVDPRFFEGAEKKVENRYGMGAPAAAEAAGLSVLHYDDDYDRITAVTNQPTEWIAPAGTLD